MPEQKEDKNSKTLGLDPVQANALFAWQHGLIDPDPYYTKDFNLFLAFISVERKAKSIGMTREELKKVTIDPAWIDQELLEEANWNKPN